MTEQREDPAGAASPWQSLPYYARQDGTRVAFRVRSTAQSVLSQLALFAALILIAVFMSYFPGYYRGVRYSAHHMDLHWASLAAVLLSVFCGLRMLLQDWVVFDFDNRLVLRRRHLAGLTRCTVMASFEQLVEVALNPQARSGATGIVLLDENGRRFEVMSPASLPTEVVTSDAAQLARKLRVRFSRGQVQTLPGRPGIQTSWSEGVSTQGCMHRLGCLLALGMVCSGVGLVGWILYQFLVDW